MQFPHQSKHQATITRHHSSRILTHMQVKTPSKPTLSPTVRFYGVMATEELQPCVCTVVVTGANNNLNKDIGCFGGDPTVLVSAHSTLYKSRGSCDSVA